MDENILTEGNLRKSLFTPCETKEALHDWIEFFLGFSLPDCTVDFDSNSNPMAVVWEVYNAARTGSKDISRLLAYSCRDGFKTMLAAMLEVLAIVHLERSVAHMAAIESQRLRRKGTSRTSSASSSSATTSLPRTSGASSSSTTTTRIPGRISPRPSFGRSLRISAPNTF